MIIIMHCHVSIGRGDSVDEDVEVEVRDDFFELPVEQQYAELADEFDSWLGSNCDSGFSYSPA